MTLNSKMISQDPVRPEEFSKDSEVTRPYAETRISAMPLQKTGLKYRTTASRQRVSYFDSSRWQRSLPFVQTIYSLINPEVDWDVITYFFNL